ncbi:MAG: 3-hydroxyacyl-ACP dehydratase FabZ [Bacteroidales bacterium]|nr:3-hydroxyacyl-ACP dehydratase FabZ [Bacteroidales bacterium]MBO5818431.1 3-hydroxyacyl-ACP dehydratase FabZ [Bacteroidales bacterium]MBO7233346.1 3-hydroxyacyl-ACP dehydratase FabZ [Bacteroidales bacterium]
MKREEIKQFLAHREPMLLVDEIDIDENKVAHGKYTVKGDEHFLQGHFPGHPVVPGVILCEIMGQCCALLVKEHLVGKTPFFTGMDKVRFPASVYPGDTIEVTGSVAMQRGMFFFIDAKAEVRGKVCSEARLSFALVDNEKLDEREAAAK